jgi:hypothetical protein
MGPLLQSLNHADPGFTIRPDSDRQRCQILYSAISAVIYTWLARPAASQHSKSDLGGRPISDDKPDSTEAPPQRSIRRAVSRSLDRETVWILNLEPVVIGFERVYLARRHDFARFMPLKDGWSNKPSYAFRPSTRALVGSRRVSEPC